MFLKVNKADNFATYFPLKIKSGTLWQDGENNNCRKKGKIALLWTYQKDEPGEIVPRHKLTARTNERPTDVASRDTKKFQKKIVRRRHKGSISVIRKKISGSMYTSETQMTEICQT